MDAMGLWERIFRKFSTSKKFRCHLQDNSYSQLEPAWAFEYESFHFPTQHAQDGAHFKPKDEKIWYRRRVDVSLKKPSEPLLLLMMMRNCGYRAEHWYLDVPGS